MGKILAIGNDHGLLYTRRLVLEHAGLAVEVAAPAEALVRLKNNSYDLLVLCHSLGADEVQLVIDAARLTHPDGQLLLLEPAKPGDSIRSGEERFDTKKGPALLVKKTWEMLGKGGMLSTAPEIPQLAETLSLVPRPAISKNLLPFTPRNNGQGLAAQRKKLFQSTPSMSLDPAAQH